MEVTWGPIAADANIVAPLLMTMAAGGVKPEEDNVAGTPVISEMVGLPDDAVVIVAVIGAFNPTLTGG